MGDSSEPSALFKSIQASRTLNQGLEQARYATMATVTEDGLPACRYVVVRDIYQHSAIVVTTDLRSRKIPQLLYRSTPPPLTADTSTPSFITSPTSPYPLSELCWWFPQTKEQYRLLSRTLVVPPSTPHPPLLALRQSTWASMSPPARSQFDAAPPGTPRQRLPQGDLDRYQAQHPSVDVVSDNFALLLFYPVKVDYVYLVKPVVSPHPIAIEVEGGVKREERDESSQGRWKLELIHEEQRWTMEELNP